MKNKRSITVHSYYSSLFVTRDKSISSLALSCSSASSSLKCVFTDSAPREIHCRKNCYALIVISIFMYIHMMFNDWGESEARSDYRGLLNKGGLRAQLNLYACSSSIKLNRFHTAIRTRQRNRSSYCDSDT